MNNIDKQYIELLKDILENGTKKTDRTGTGTISVFGRQIRHKMSEGFPILTTKKVAFKTMVTELLYFLRGNTSIEYLVDNECNIWNGDLSKYHDVDVSKYKELAKSDSNLYEGGAIYPHQWRNFGSNDYNRKRITIPFKTSFVKESHNVNSNNENVGKEYSTLEYGNYIVLDSFKQGDRNETYYKIQFINTNTVKNIRRDKLGANIVDPYMPSKNGVACVGEYKKYNHLNIEKLKNIWNGMISRCYNPSNDNYMYYGGRGVYVENRWLCFEYFLSDVDKIINWENKLNNWDEYELDKDVYGDGFKYSLETCCWLSKSDNSKKSKEKFTYKVSNDVDEYEFINHVDFMNKFKINNQGNFASMLRGDRLNCEGWYLISKNKLSNGIDQIEELINTLKTNPDSRRMLVTAWNPTQLHDLCLPACHYGFQVYTRKLSLEERKIEYFNRGYTPNIDPLDLVPTRAISLMWNQRSVDTPLGCPINIISYALLLEIIAKMVNMVPDELIGNLGDCHIYLNQIEGVKEQIGRDLTEEERYNIWFTNNYETGMERYFDPNNLPNYDDPYYEPTPKRTREPFSLPKLKHIKSDEFYRQLSDDFSIITQIRNTDFVLEEYKSHPKIYFPLSN